MITDTFDSDTPAIIYPRKKASAPKVDACIITFSNEIERAVLERYGCRKIAALGSVSGAVPVYAMRRSGKTIAFFRTYVGAPVTVGFIEDTITELDCTRYVLFGGAGCLDKEIAHGKVMVPTAAYRDEGTSYHYAPAADYITVKNAGVVADFMRQNGIPYVAGKTWTTDGFWRETRGNFQKRKAEGCISVEMECAAVQAACDFRGLELYAFFTCGDLLDAPEWDARHKNEVLAGTQHDARHFDIALALADAVTNAAAG